MHDYIECCPAISSFKTSIGSGIACVESMPCNCTAAKGTCCPDNWSIGCELCGNGVLCRNYSGSIIASSEMYRVRTKRSSVVTRQQDYFVEAGRRLIYEVEATFQHQLEAVRRAAAWRKLVTEHPNTYVRVWDEQCASEGDSS